MEWLCQRIQGWTGVDERTSRVAALIITIVAVSCAVPSLAAIGSSWWQTSQLEQDQAVARAGYVRRTDAIIANHRTIITNEAILCRAQHLQGCSAAVHEPAER